MASAPITSLRAGVAAVSGRASGAPPAGAAVATEPVAAGIIVCSSLATWSMHEPWAAQASAPARAPAASTVARRPNLVMSLSCCAAFTGGGVEA